MKRRRRRRRRENNRIVVAVAVVVVEYNRNVVAVAVVLVVEYNRIPFRIPCDEKKEKKNVNFDYQNVNSLYSSHHFVNSSC